MYHKLCELISERGIQYDSFVDDENDGDWVIVLTLRNDEGDGKLFQVITPTTTIESLWWLT